MSTESRSCAVGERSVEMMNMNGHVGPHELFSGVQSIEAGDGIVALADDGLRWSGIPGARAALSLGFGEHWQEVSVPVNDGSDEEQLLDDFVHGSPKLSPIAAEKLVERMIASQVTVHGVANPSGTGLAGELQSLLAPTEFGADITDPHEPSRIMRLIQTFRRELVYEIPDRALERRAQADKRDKKAPLPTRPASDRDMYKFYPMGHGHLIISPEPEAVVAEAEALGQRAKHIGSITTHRVLTIVSRGMNQRDTILEYEL
ncbi:MAG TPA: AIR synthase-related protein [Candidatus Saccharimonadales bacterium]|nr:AIR synthase-related protein [Candidatus Saccharimonadales bacterium]